MAKKNNKTQLSTTPATHSLRFNDQEVNDTLARLANSGTYSAQGVVLTHNPPFQTPHLGDRRRLTYSTVVRVGMDNGIKPEGNGISGTVNVLSQEGYIGQPGEAVEFSGKLVNLKRADKPSDLQCWLGAGGMSSVIALVPTPEPETFKNAPRLVEAA